MVDRSVGGRETGMEYSFRSSISLSSSTSCSSSYRSDSLDSVEYWPPASEVEEIPSRRWLLDTLRSTPSRGLRSPVPGAEKAGPASTAVAGRNKYSPPEYRGILERAAVPVRFSTYEDLHARLRREPILIDGGQKSFGLEKLTGKACYMLSSDELENQWGVFRQNDADWKSLPKSRFPDVTRDKLALYRPFCVFVTVDTAVLSPQTSYAAYLVFQYRPSLFRRQQIIALVMTAGHVLISRRAVWLEPYEEGDVEGGWTKKVGDFVADAGKQPGLAAAAEPQERGDGWMEVELGEFAVEGEGEGEEVFLLLLNGHRRQYSERLSVAVEGVELRPKR